MFIPILFTHLLGPMSSHTWFRCDAQISVTWDFSHAGISNLKPWSIGWMNTWTPKDLPLQNRCFKKKINDQMPRKTRTPYLPGIDIYQGIHKHCRLQSPKKTPNKYGIRMNHGTVPIYLKLATPRLGSCFIFFPRMYLEYLTNAWFLGKNCGESFFGW